MPDDKLFLVGKYIERFNTLTRQSIPCGPIYQSSGLLGHITKRHPGKESYLRHVREIISFPDYIGKHPHEPNSLELVKILDQNVMVCIKLDTQKNYLFVASVYEISKSKLENRLYSGRLKKY